MTLRGLRNIAFVGMIVGGVCLGVANSNAEGGCDCCLCEGPGSEDDCLEVGAEVQGWTECQDSSNCSVSGSTCKGIEE